MILRIAEGRREDEAEGRRDEGAARFLSADRLRFIASPDVTGGSVVSRRAGMLPYTEDCVSLAVHIRGCKDAKSCVFTLTDEKKHLRPDCNAG